MKRHALLIGVPRYHDARITPLRYAAADARALGEALRAKCAFDHVTVLAGEGTDGEPTVTTILDALEAMAHRVQAGDLFFLGFSGHGAELPDRKEGVLYAADTRALHPAANSLSLNTLRDLLARLKAQWLVLLVDACRDHPVAGKGAGDYRLGAEFAKNLVGTVQAGSGRTRATAFLSACQPGQRAHEWPAFGHGVCSHYLLEGLNGKAWTAGRLTMRGLAKHAEGQLADWSGSSGLQQQPWFEQFGTEDIVLGEDHQAIKAAEEAAIAAAQRSRPEQSASPTANGFQKPSLLLAVLMPAMALALVAIAAKSLLRTPSSPDAKVFSEALDRIDRFAEVTNLTNAAALERMEGYFEAVLPALSGSNSESVKMHWDGLKFLADAHRRLDELATGFDPEADPLGKALSAGVSGAVSNIDARVLQFSRQSTRGAVAELKGKANNLELFAIRLAILQTVSPRFNGNDFPDDAILAGRPLSYAEKAMENSFFLTNLPPRLASIFRSAATNTIAVLHRQRAEVAYVTAKRRLDALSKIETPAKLKSTAEEIRPWVDMTTPIRRLELASAAVSLWGGHKFEGEISARLELIKAINNARQQPFTNSLGMTFSPVFTSSTYPSEWVLFSIWETRVGDYAPFSSTKAGADASWKNPGFPQDDSHPVVMVSWEDAQAFCAWLTLKERGEGWIGRDQVYRLPTDAEWSWAIGIGEAEEQAGNGRSPEDKNVKIAAGSHPWAYPWGREWPPPKAAGNYSSSFGVDTYEYTSPVGSFRADRNRLYDLGGNVWEWVEDFYDGKSSTHCMRGASFADIAVRSDLLASLRARPARNLGGQIGFRVVLAHGDAR